MAGSDIRSAHLQTSGYVFKGRARVRALDVVGLSGADGTLEIWDTDEAPVDTGTYNRSGTTVTVTDTDHGLRTGDRVGISFETGTGGCGTNGNYPITVVDSDTFTLTDINSGTVTGDADCRYLGGKAGSQTPQWKATWRTSAGDIYFNGFNIPVEGLLCNIGVYIYVDELSSVNIYFA